MLYEQENYLTPSDFDLFVGVLPQVVTKRKAYTPKDVQWSSRLQYFCGLRISEALTIMPSDIDLDHLILTLNHTKTGFKKCKCAKFEKRKLVYSNPNCYKCKGKGKIRIPQYTTIPPQIRQDLANYLDSKPKTKKLFSFSRWTARKYYKQAGETAGLNIREQQTEKTIEGIWTHLLRKCRAKLMKNLGADEDLIKIKLRKKVDSFDTYTNPDLQVLKQWEYENLS